MDERDEPVFAACGDAPDEEPTHADPPVLVVDDRAGGRRDLADCFSGGRTVVTAADRDEAVGGLRQAGGVGLAVVAAGTRDDALEVVTHLRTLPGHETLPAVLVVPASPPLEQEPDVGLPPGVDVLTAPVDGAALRRRADLFAALDAAVHRADRLREENAAARRQWRRDLLDSPVPTALVHPGEVPRVCTVNSAFAALVGGAPQDWEGRRLTLRVHREDAAAVEGAVAAVAGGEESRREAAARWVSGDLATVRSTVTVGRVEWPTGTRPHLRAQVSVSVPAERPQDAPRPGGLDPLTGLPDRRLLLRQLRYALGRARRSESSVAVIAVDLDEFGGYEAARGRELADRLVVQVANRLGTVLRPGDVVARLGRDAFGLLCEDVASEAVARHIAERVRIAVRAVGLPGEDEPAGLTASVGLAVSGAPDEHEQLMWRAEQALRRAKESGRDRTSLRPDTAEDPGEHLRQRLRAALDAAALPGVPAEGNGAGLLSLHYQPVIDLERRRVVGVEALVRLRDPEHGLVMPDEFLPAAEYGDEITRLGEWVLDEACAQLSRWSSAHPGLTVSVNLSARQLTGADVVDLTRRRLSRHGLPPQALRVEVAEADLLDRAGRVHRAVAGLASLGVDVAVDRFGTGSSSLTSLRGMPLRTLKVDASLVHGVAASREGTAVVAALLTLGRALGMRTVAVGVESAEQEEALRALGCHDAQGFHLGAPRSAPQMARMLAVAP